MKPYLMSNFPSVRPSLNLQFDSQPTPADMTSHLASVGATFSRASIGTYVDANGLVAEATSGQARPNYSTDGVHEGLLIEEARTNLLKSSEDFSTSDYVERSIDIIINKAIAPDGLSGADFLKEDDTAVDLHYLQYSSTFSATTYTFSVFAKNASGTRFLTLRPGGVGTGVAYADFDLVNGEIPSGKTGGTEFDSAKIEDYGNGWYRCSMTATYSVAPSSFMLVINDGTSELPYFNGDNTSGFYIWGAQIEQGSFPTSYIPTIPTFDERLSPATFFDSDGVLQTQTSQSGASAEGRIDHKYIDGEWVEAGLLLEGESTNKILDSRDMTTGNWIENKTGTVSRNQIGIDGVSNTACLLEDNDASNRYSAYQNITVVNDSNTHTSSVFIKKNQSTFPVLQIVFLGGTTLQYTLQIDTDSGDILAVNDATNDNISIEDYGDWWKCTVNGANNSSGNTTLRLNLLPSFGSSLGNFDISATGSTIFDQAQVELNTSQSSSPIITEGSTATRSADVYTTATKERSADVCYIDGTAFTDFYNQEQGTVLIDFDTDDYASTQNFVSINDGTNNNRYVWYFASSGFLNFRKVVSGSNNQVNSGSSITTFLPDIKMVAYYDLLGAGFLIEGTDGDSLSETTQLNLNKLEINSITKWTIKKFIYFPRKLSTAEFEKLTQ